MVFPEAQVYLPIPSYTSATAATPLPKKQFLRLREIRLHGPVIRRLTTTSHRLARASPQQHINDLQIAPPSRRVQRINLVVVCNVWVRARREQQPRHAHVFAEDCAVQGRAAVAAAGLVDVGVGEDQRRDYPVEAKGRRVVQRGGEPWVRVPGHVGVEDLDPGHE